MILDQPPPPPDNFSGGGGVAPHTRTYTLGAYPDGSGYAPHRQETEMITHTTINRFTGRAVR